MFGIWLMRTIVINETALQYRSVLSLVGVHCDLTTNSRILVNTLRPWRNSAEEISKEQIILRISVDGSEQGNATRPHFRGLHHLVFVSFGASNVFVLDLLQRVVTGVVTEAIAQDAQFWNWTMLPIVIGVLGTTVNVVPIHCACVAVNGSGVLIAGTSGAGKSTFSAALAQREFDFVSDDWTYVSRGRQLMAHGMGVPIKLLPDAVEHFSELQGRPVLKSLNGELAYQVDAQRVFGAKPLRACEPQCFVFLERSEQQTSELIPISGEEVQNYLELSAERLPAQLASAVRQRSNVIAHLAALPCWIYRYGGTPQFGADQFHKLFQKEALVA